MNKKDAILVLSVGGGDETKQISANLVSALKHAKATGTQVIGIVGKSTGYTAQVADACVIVPTVDPDLVTAHTESFQAVIWHLLVFHPMLKTIQGKWESVTENKK